MTEGFTMLRRGPGLPVSPLTPLTSLMFEAPVSMTTKEEPGPHDHDGGFKNMWAPSPFLRPLHSFSRLVSGGIRALFTHLERVGGQENLEKWSEDSNKTLFRHKKNSYTCHKLYVYPKVSLEQKSCVKAHRMKVGETAASDRWDWSLPRGNVSKRITSS